MVRDITLFQGLLLPSFIQWVENKSIPGDTGWTTITKTNAASLVRRP
jgi:hypothetical protein